VVVVGWQWVIGGGGGLAVGCVLLAVGWRWVGGGSVVGYRWWRWVGGGL
jgi:hypothetical protein